MRNLSVITPLKEEFRKSSAGREENRKRTVSYHTTAERIQEEFCRKRTTERVLPQRRIQAYVNQHFAYQKTFNKPHLMNSESSSRNLYLKEFIVIF
jgi:hypothetical protein